MESGHSVGLASSGPDPAAPVCHGQAHQGLPVQGRTAAQHHPPPKPPPVQTHPSPAQSPPTRGNTARIATTTPVCHGQATRACPCGRPGSPTRLRAAPSHLRARQRILHRARATVAASIFSIRWISSSVASRPGCAFSTTVNATCCTGAAMLTLASAFASALRQRRNRHVYVSSARAREPSNSASVGQGLR